MVDKIIFLDIDGPLIPGTRYLENPDCSFQQDFCPRCLMVLRKILEQADAKIVFNSTHNLHLYPDSESLYKKKGEREWLPGLIPRFEQHGLSEYLHKHCHTGYPYDVKYDFVPEGHNSTTRLRAIFQWLHEHYDMEQPNQVLWVAFDDEPIDHKRAGLVDFDAGLTLEHYKFAGKMLNFNTGVIL